MKELINTRNEETFKTPGELIKYTRKKMGYSQKYTAYKVGMTPSGLSKVESGTHFLPRNLLELTQFLKIDPHQLIQLNTNKNKEKEKEMSSVEKFKSQFPNWKEIMLQVIQEM